jgi:hypothetical protein
MARRQGGFFPWFCAPKGLPKLGLIFVPPQHASSSTEFMKSEVPFLKQIAQEIEESQSIEIAMDQLLGPDTGRVLNDASADLASSNIKPEEAAKAIEASWQQNKP